MQERIEEKGCSSSPLYLVYDHGTHFVFPQKMLKMFLPICSSLFVKIFFRDAKKFGKECKETRIDIENNLVNEFKKWASEF